jgi:MFS family permease
MDGRGGGRQSGLTKRPEQRLKRSDGRRRLDHRRLTTTVASWLHASKANLPRRPRTLPLLAQRQFHLDAYTAALTYILAFGVAKAFTNYAAGTWSDRYGRKPVLVVGWWSRCPCRCCSSGPRTGHGWSRPTSCWASANTGQTALLPQRATALLAAILVLQLVEEQRHSG